MFERGDSGRVGHLRSPGTIQMPETTNPQCFVTFSYLIGMKIFLALDIRSIKDRGDYLFLVKMFFLTKVI